MPKADFTSKSPGRCPECGSTEVFFDRGRGELVCRGCGLVIEENALDPGPEWRSFTLEEREARARAGAPASLAIHDKGLPTEISPDGRNSRGRKLTGKAKAQYHRLRKRQIRSSVHGSAERNLAQAMNDLAGFADRLSAPPSVREQAAALYRKALKKDLVRGRSIRGVVAACLYAALRISVLPRSLKEVSKACRVERKELARCYRLIVEELNISVPRSNASLFLLKIAEAVNVSKGTVEVAAQILREADEKHFSLGKDPRGLAAAAIYAASKIVGEELTQRELAHAADVTEVTVRNHFKGLCRTLGIKVPHRKGG